MGKGKEEQMWALKGMDFIWDITSLKIYEKRARKSLLNYNLIIGNTTPF